MTDELPFANFDGPRIDNLILGYQVCEVFNRIRQEHPGVQVTLTEVADRLGIERHYLYRRLARLEKNLGGAKLITTVKGTGITRINKKLFQAIGSVLRQLDQLTNPTPDSRPLVVQVRTTHVLSSRILPRPEHEFLERWRRENPERAIELHREVAEPSEILETESGAENELVVTSLPPGAERPRDVQFLVQHQIHPCLLCPTGHTFKAHGFDWEQLKEETLIVLRNTTSAPNFPWRLVDRHAAAMIRVGTAVEAHEMVSAGMGVFITYEELLTQHEQKYLEVVPLPDVPKVRILLFCRKRPGRSVLERQALRSLRDHIRSRFNHLESRREQAKRLSSAIAGFRTFWAVRFASQDDNSNPAPYWIPADVRLEVTPSGYVRGTYRTYDADDTERVDYEVFGRSRAYKGMTHLICRATHVSPLPTGPKDAQFKPFEDHGDAHFLYPTAEFDDATDSLVGLWCGRGVQGLGHGLVVLRKDHPSEVTKTKLVRLFQRISERKDGAYRWINPTDAEHEIATWLVPSP